MSLELEEKLDMDIHAQSAAVAKPALPWDVWARQVAAIARLEFGKNFLGKRAVLMYLLAGLPVVLTAAMALFPITARKLADPATATEAYSVVFETVILRLSVFFGCAWIFMNLFRGEVIDRSLHYYFLSPVRREVLTVGKYLSGLVGTMTLFVGATALTLFFIHMPRGASASVNHILYGPGLKYIAAYLGIVAFACVGYGAVFLLVGLYFRNPFFPAIAIAGWEFIGFLLPPVLKKISVLHYLKSLTPVPMSEGPFAVVVEPTPAWVSVPGLLVFTAVTLVLAGWWTRKMEIRYGGE